VAASVAGDTRRFKPDLLDPPLAAAPTVLVLLAAVVDSVVASVVDVEAEIDSVAEIGLEVVETDLEVGEDDLLVVASDIKAVDDSGVIVTASEVRRRRTRLLDLEDDVVGMVAHQIDPRAVGTVDMDSRVAAADLIDVVDLEGQVVGLIVVVEAMIGAVVVIGMEVEETVMIVVADTTVVIVIVVMIMVVIGSVLMTMAEILVVVILAVADTRRRPSDTDGIGRWVCTPRYVTV